MNADVSDIESAFQAQQAKIDSLTQNLQNLHNKPILCQLRPNISVNTSDFNKNKAFMFLVHAYLLSRFRDSQRVQQRTAAHSHWIFSLSDIQG